MTTQTVLVAGSLETFYYVGSRRFECRADALNYMIEAYHRAMHA